MFFVERRKKNYSYRLCNAFSFSVIIEIHRKWNNCKLSVNFPTYPSLLKFCKWKPWARNSNSSGLLSTCYLRRVNYCTFYVVCCMVYRMCIWYLVIMKSALKWPLQMAVMDKLSWRLQSTFLIGLIGLSSKIFLGECWQRVVRSPLKKT